MQRCTIKVAGLKGRYLEAGRGPEIVIVASMLVLATLYRRPLAVLAREFRVIVLEMPGTGWAGRLPRPWSFEEYANWLAGFLGRIDLHQPILLGHSNSGPPALILAARYPELISTLVLADSVGTHPTHSLADVIAGRARDALREPRLTLTKAHQPLFNAVFHRRNLFNQIRLAASFDASDIAREVNVPTRILWGTRDSTMPAAARRRFIELMPQATVYVDPTGSHDWIVEHPKTLLHALLERPRFVAGETRQHDRHAL